MYCQYCSADNPDEARFCRDCGSPVRIVSDPKNQHVKENKGGIGKFIGAAILSAMGMIFLLASLIEGQFGALVIGGIFTGIAYQLFKKR